MRRVASTLIAAALASALPGFAYAEPEKASPAETKPAAEPAKPADAPAVAPEPALNRVEKEGGLIIEDLKIGDGPEVTALTPAVIADYKGTFKSDGAEFDSSYRRGQPASFPLKGVIKGWQQGVPGMKVGGKRRLTVPAALAYGEKGYVDRRNGKQVIPGNADLVFEIDLKNILVVEDLKVGDGAECTSAQQTVKIFYRGTLKSDGSEFDGNVGKEPVEFPLSNLIQGWQYGIPGMKVGGKRKLTIPYQMGYGERGSPPKIPSKADLVFEIELLDVK